MSKRFSTSVNINKTRSFPGADIGSDHDMLMMTFSLHLKNPKKNKFTRNKFDLEKLKNPETKKLFEKKINEKLTEQKLTEIENTEEMLQKLNITMTETQTEILGKHREKKKKWITNELMDMCDLRRELKKTKFEPGSTYKQINNTIKKEMRIAKEIWINNKCTDIGECLIRNNTKKAYQIVNELTKEKDKIIVNVHDKDGKYITDKTEVLKRWMEYCSELYTHNAEGDISVLTVNEPSDQDNFHILESEVKAAIQALKIGKSAGIDNIPAELIKAGGHIVIQILLDICNKIWETGIWPSDWKKSMIISLHKK